MKKLIDYVKSHTKLLIGSIIFIAIVTIAIPLLLNLLFKIPAPFYFLSAEWTADSVLNFYGTTLSFLSTTALSVLALWQNQVIKKANDEHTEILRRMEIDKNAPVILLEYKASLANGHKLKFIVKNISENIATEVSIENIKLKSQTSKPIWEDKTCYSTKFLYINQEYEVKLENDPFPNSSYQLVMGISYRDKFQNIYKRKVIGSLDGNNKINLIIL